MKVIKAVRYLHEDKTEIHREESGIRSIHIRTLVCDKGANATQKIKDSPFQQKVWEQSDIYRPKNELFDPYLYHIEKLTQNRTQT